MKENAIMEKSQNEKQIKLDGWMGIKKIPLLQATLLNFSE